MVELMIWGTWNGVQPAGSAVKTGQTITGVTGTWDIWEQGTMSDSAGHSWHYIAYRPTTAQTGSLSVSIGAFMTNAASQNFNGLGTGWYVMGVQAGVEIYNSTGTFTTNSFSVSGL
jgi:hypothetical protein